MTPEMLDVDAVLARYGLRDRRAARRIMDDAGGFVIAGKAVVRLADLLAHEEALKAARRPHTAPVSRPRATGRQRRPQQSTGEQLPAGWWRDSGTLTA